MYRTKTKDGRLIELGQNEVLEDGYPCPKCGGQLVTNHGPGIECTFCLDCEYNDYDYTDLDV